MRISLKKWTRRSITGALIAAAGLLLTLGSLSTYAVGSWSESRDRDAFVNLSHAEDDVARNIEPGKALAVLTVPRLGLSVLVRAGVSKDVLARGAGWVPGTALPGNSGNSAIAAHRDTFFRDLKGIKQGDIVTLEANGALNRYLVKSLNVVAPSATEVLHPTRETSVTLITCYPFHYIGPAPERFIVRAVRIPS